MDFKRARKLTTAAVGNDAEWMKSNNILKRNDTEKGSLDIWFHAAAFQQKRRYAITRHPQRYIEDYQACISFLKPTHT